MFNFNGIRKCLRLLFYSELIWSSFAEVLAAGTSMGRVALWHMVTVSDQKGDTKTQWKLQTPAEVEGNISQLQVQHPSEVYSGIFPVKKKKSSTNNVYKLIINITWMTSMSEVSLPCLFVCSGARVHICWPSAAATAAVWWFYQNMWCVLITASRWQQCSSHQHSSVWPTSTPTHTSPSTQTHTSELCKSPR